MQDLSIPVPFEDLGEREEALDERLLAWQRARDAGRILPVEDLCPGDPAGQDQLRAWIGAVHGFEAFAGDDDDQSSTESRPVTVPENSDVARLRDRNGVADRIELAHGSPTENHAAQTITEQIGKYRLVRPLGQGGQGSAYLAFDPDLKHHVVLKRYRVARIPAGQVVVLNEGQGLARVRSPFVAQCYSAERRNGECYLVIEYIAGKNLATAHHERPLDFNTAARVVEHVAEGLAAVHACGLLHRDVKPSNIILGDDGKPRLVDFGLAAPLGGEALQTVTGTLAYMAPEQARGEWDRIDPRTDVFSLGAVLYELLTGSPPYTGMSSTEKIEQAKLGRVTPPRDQNPRVPRARSDLHDRDGDQPDRTVCDSE